MFYAVVTEEKALKPNRPIGGFFDKIKNFFLSLWSKITSFFKNIYSKVCVYFSKKKVNAKIKKETSDKELLKSKNPEVALWKENPEKYRQKRSRRLKSGR